MGKGFETDQNATLDQKGETNDHAFEDGKTTTAANIATVTSGTNVNAGKGTEVCEHYQTAKDVGVIDRLVKATTTKPTLETNVQGTT